MEAADPFDPAQRVVKPRGREYPVYPVIAVMHNEVLTEDGELFDINTLIARLPKMAPTLFVTANSGDFVARLDVIYSQWATHTWQWRASTNERNIVRPDGVRVASRITTAIHYFGWQNGNYHRIIDPITMYGHRLDKIWPGRESQIVRLRAWGMALRDFCAETGIDIRPTIGAISSQFLVHPKFYPDARRKVPAKINQRVREELPGNHYVLNVTPGSQREFTAHYIDQHRAHHYHAASTPLPDANSLYAYGRFTDLAACVFDGVIDDFMGLYCCDLDYRRRGSRAFSWMPKLARHYEAQFVYSNELPHLRDMGFTVTGVRAAWGSRRRDTGLPKYAQWAMQQLDQYDNAPWLKPLLLSTYGVLATRARCSESVFRLAKQGEETTLHTGKHSLSGKLTRGRKKLEPRIANVLHRGMIEAATRSESVGLAQYLSHLGHQVLSIYADAVIVTADEDRPLPPLPEPWRYKKQLNHLQFINQQAFISGEMTKLPGVSQELRHHTLRVKVPSLVQPSVAEIMEQEELVNTLLTKTGANHGYAESVSQ